MKQSKPPQSRLGAQRSRPEAVLRETLERAGIVPPQEISVLAAEPWAYRNRVRVAFDSSGSLGYRSRRSRQIVPLRECPIAVPLLIRVALVMGEYFRPFPAAQ